MSTLLTAKDVQEILLVDRSTVYRMAEDGRIPAVKVGRQWRFDSAEIHTLLGNKNTVAQHNNQSTSSSRLHDILPLDCVQLVQDGFADALDVMIIMTDMQGNPITEPSNPCGLFTALHAYPQVWQTCVDHWHEMAAKPVIAPTFTHSSLGLLCARGLIRVGSSLEGMVFVGGLAPDNWPPTGTQLDNMAHKLGVTVDLLQPHLDDVYHLTSAERDHVLALIQRIADIVSHIASERTILKG
ncbi:MAG: PocR ligand-binding domain-containing protein [Anaerolineae bacterium]|nr:PocR ligand-binding domain-containing protein [Anaerolineae bacterium]MCO5191288.1 PocR ligand-binding domain-containing protein [Anaerolineae bacterium]MCO5192960.1 PocR ligand-binding domain-containing protein [Anaerolineae bacterium]